MGFAVVMGSKVPGVIWSKYISKVQLLPFFYRFDMDVYNGMAVCRGKVEGDTLNGVDPNMIKPTNGNNQSNSSSSVTVTTGLLTILITMLIQESPPA